MTLLALPPGYSRIQRVFGFEALVNTPFAQGVNALCWERALPGDFAEIVALLGAGEGIVTLDESALQKLPVSAAGRTALGVLLADQHLLRDRGLDPVLNCIYGYPSDDSPGPVPTDVFSFHADSATTEADTYLCTYCGSPSEGLRQEDALKRVDQAETRAELLRLYGGADDDGFREFLHEHCYDLHYAARPGARPYSFGLGHLWRIAIETPASPVPPCVHRAPATVPGQPRLMMIS